MKSQVNPQKPDFIDPDDLCLAQVNRVKRQIIDGIDFRLGTLASSGERFKAEKIEELEALRAFIKGILYKKDSYKELI